jgi:hypothetical protein
LKIQFAGRTVDAHLQLIVEERRWILRVGPILLSPASVVRLRARLHGATDIEKMRLANSGYAASSHGERLHRMDT